jgi:membrane protease YdiL (CAAX protease family)
MNEVQFEQTKLQQVLNNKPSAILLELILVFAPLYLGLMCSAKMNVHHTYLFGDLVLLGGLLSYLGITISLVILWISSRLRGSGWAEIGAKNPGKWWVTILKGLGIALAILGAVVLIINPLLNCMPNLEPRDMSRFQILEGNIPNLIINLVIIWITAGFLEELLWRGYLLNRMMDIFKSSSLITWTTVIIISSVVFGLGHNYQGMYGVLKTGFIGFVFGLGYLAVGKNIWPLVIAHSLIDSFDMIGHFFGG